MNHKLLMEITAFVAPVTVILLLFVLHRLKRQIEELRRWKAEAMAGFVCCTNFL